MYVDRDDVIKTALHTPMLNPDEARQLAIVRGPDKDYPQNRYIHDLVAAQATMTPEATALVAGDQILSYKELNRRANQLAHLLQALGVRPGTLVGICMERSPELVVGLLGILKAGGAYVPLDPDYPPERLSFMLRDAQPPVLLTQDHLAARLPATEAHVVCLDSDAMQLAQQNESDPPCAAVSTDLAYVIYTSGSTGRPKGAQITHSNLLNLVYWHQQAFAVTASDRATQIASPAFDATGWELWPYLALGASVSFIDQETRLSPDLLRDWLVSRRITIAFLPTVLAESVMGLAWPPTTALRFLLTGADTLHRYPSPTLPFALINNYGLTETAVVSTCGQVHPTEHTDIPPSIGCPIANTQIYILDEQLHPVSLGEPGELCIGGAGVGRGYLNCPELTAQKFLDDPFSARAGSLLYRTGDIAFVRPDGQIEFVGRADQQIKIRGYRIEPNEIVSLLNEHPSIATSIVIAREDTPGDKRLVAYVVAVTGAQISSGELQELLVQRLPDYMVPATYVQLEALPITANGKVDRTALSVPDATNMLRDEVETAFNTPTEECVAGIIASLLGLEKVGIDENFFMLGGHSLLGTQLIARVGEVFGVDLSLRTLFESPTVRELSDEIEQRIVAQLEMMSDDEAQRLTA